MVPAHHMHGSSTLTALATFGVITKVGDSFALVPFTHQSQVEPIRSIIELKSARGSPWIGVTCSRHVLPGC
jgi:hypothetical protein